MSLELEKKKCVPCEGGMPPLLKKDIEPLLKELTEEWEVLGFAKISHEFKFKDFAGALSFVNKIGEVAESEGHHPDITLSWGKVGVTLTTHAIGGLSLNDFILARKIEIIYNEQSAAL